MSVFRLTLIVAMMSLAVPATAADYDLAADWNPGANPNGAWSYRSGNAILPYFSSFPTILPPGVGGYAPTPAVGSFLPLFIQPGGSGTDINVHSYDPFNGGAASGEATLAWTSPITGTMDVGGYLYYGQPGLQRSNDISVKLGSTVLLTGTVGYNQHQDFANRLLMSFNDLTVSAGDVLTISFVRSPGFAPGTMTALDVSVHTTPVPEPESYAMLLAGLGLSGLFARRRKQDAA